MKERMAEDEGSFYREPEVLSARTAKRACVIPKPRVFSSGARDLPLHCRRLVHILPILRPVIQRGFIDSMSFIFSLRRQPLISFSRLMAASGWKKRS
jgi:hypothetical protein